MNYIKRISCLLWTSVIFLGIHSICYLFMPLASAMADTTNRIPLLVLGSIFWLTMIAGYILLIIANAERRRFIKLKMHEDYKMGCRIGILTFFDNPLAIAADSICFASLAFFGVLLFLQKTDMYVSYILLFLFSLSFHMHCILNGRIYKITKYRPIRRKKHE